jgi:hypothetical protein
MKNVADSVRRATIAFLWPRRREIWAAHAFKVDQRFTRVNSTCAGRVVSDGELVVISAAIWRCRQPSAKAWAR